MAEMTINYWAVLLSAVACFLLGGLWYSPVLFAKPWMDGMAKCGVTEEMLKHASPVKPFLGAFLLSLLMAWVLADVVDFARAVTWLDGLKTGFWMWAGFVATSMCMNGMFALRPVQLIAIDAGYYLAALLIQGVILTLW